MDQAMYREVLRKTQKTLIEETCIKRYRASIKLLMGAKKSTPQPNGSWQRKVESPPRLGLGTILGLLG